MTVADPPVRGVRPAVDVAHLARRALLLHRSVSHGSRHSSSRARATRSTFFRTMPWSSTMTQSPASFRMAPLRERANTTAVLQQPAVDASEERGTEHGEPHGFLLHELVDPLPLTRIARFSPSTLQTTGAPSECPVVKSSSCHDVIEERPRETRSIRASRATGRVGARGEHGIPPRSRRRHWSSWRGDASRALVAPNSNPLSPTNLRGRPGRGGAGEAERARLR